MNNDIDEYVPVQQIIADEVENFKQNLRSNEYIIIPGVFEPDDIENTQNSLLDAIVHVVKTYAPEIALPIDGSADKDILLLLSKVREIDEDLSRQLRRKIIATIGYNVPEFFKESAALKFVIENVLGLTSAQYTLFLISICLPHSRNISDGLLGWHQDLDGTGKYTVWSPILDHDSFSEGYLKLMVGDFGPLPHTITGEHNDVNTIPEAALPKGKLVRVSCRKGDVIIWNNMLLHASGSNYGTMPRYAFMIWVDGEIV